LENSFLGGSVTGTNTLPEAANAGLRFREVTAWSKFASRAASPGRNLRYEHRK
jgi:hypothetical protein